MPIEKLGHQTERQKERARKALERVKMMVEEINKTIERYNLIDTDSIEGMKLIEFNEAAESLTDTLSTPDERG